MPDNGFSSGSFREHSHSINASDFSPGQAEILKPLFL